ncbi:O-acetyl-ADP-ribose deacetylase [Fodinicurvata sediminis]|uniref:O-acetyl-ADP-ribose deacetylase n=1 Tax=Fodinicurvata sediminis TaxID=1121832 RepID=UPI0003B79579|nr:O-acetyl-ADP-ribose deacetylase [Fodinicurvata sediminis]
MTERKLELYKGDITQLAVDAIVNAANSELRPGGGVCGAIHRAAGPELAEACRRLGGCPTGESRITPGFGLPATHVIHAVGPVWQGGDSGEEDALASCYRNSLRLAEENGLDSLAFPAISTGIFGFPMARAARIAVSSVREAMKMQVHPARVVFCVFDEETAAVYRDLLSGDSPE